MRVRGYRREWLDQLVMSGEVVWGRIWGAGASPIRTTPICLLRRDDLDAWAGLSQRPQVRELGAHAQALMAALQSRGAMFLQDLSRATKLLPVELETGLGELIAQGVVTCDSFAALRWLIVPASRRRAPIAGMGRFSLTRQDAASEPPVEFIARQLLKRTGVVFRRTIVREKQPVAWRDLVRCYRTLEARGEVRGGRFVAGFDGEQYALPEAVTLLRAIRKRDPEEPLSVSASDPLNFRGILTPDERVAPTARTRVLVG
jgi:ATP-dependent Lhr-like helicase